MRVAIPSEKPDLDAKVGARLGTSQYLMVIDTKTMAVETLPGSGVSGPGSGGMQAVAVAISKKVDAVLTGYCSPTAEKYLSANGIDVLIGVSGTVAEVVHKYKNGKLCKHLGASQKFESKRPGFDMFTLLDALKKSSKQFINLLPMMVGVMLLIGLFNAFVSREFISSLFSGDTLMDTLWAVSFGSIFTGNPINSYIIGGELLKYGVSLCAVTGLIVAWVTVGLVQLPAEIGALGSKFALVRNAISLALSIAIAFATVGILNLITG